MRMEMLPGCCNADIIFDFGGTYATYMNPKMKVNKAKLENQLVNVMRISKHRMIVCTTNDQQTDANELLRKYGFKHSKWMEKDVHPETKIRLWWLEPQEVYHAK